MNHAELRAAHERLKAQVAAQLKPHPPEETESSDLRQLLEHSQALTQEYNEKLTEPEAQIAELKHKLFGPKADRLTPEQQEQLSALNQDLKAEAQRPYAASNRILWFTGVPSPTSLPQNQVIPAVCPLSTDHDRYLA